MPTLEPPPQRRSHSAQVQPMLRNGDTYTQPEFHRIYEQMPEGFKAELIDGEVYIDMFPLTHEGHGAQDFNLNAWLGQYAAETPGVDGGANSTTILNRKSEPQPDVLLRILPEYGGKTTLEHRYLRGAPELVGEVAYSSVSIDIGRKKRDYESAGIQEYIVWRTEDNELDWWELRDGTYIPLPRAEDGSIQSRVFPGLLLDVKALLRRDLRTVLRRLRDQIGHGRHAEFCAELERKHSI